MTGGEFIAAFSAECLAFSQAMLVSDFPVSYPETSINCAAELEVEVELRSEDAGLLCTESSCAWSRRCPGAVWLQRPLSC